MGSLKEIMDIRNEVLGESESIEEGRRIKIKRRRSLKDKKANIEKKMDYRRKAKQISRERKKKRKTASHRMHQQALEKIGRPKRGYRRTLKVKKVFKDWLE